MHTTLLNRLIQSFDFFEILYNHKSQINGKMERPSSSLFPTNSKRPNNVRWLVLTNDRHTMHRCKNPTFTTRKKALLFLQRFNKTTFCITRWPFVICRTLNDFNEIFFCCPVSLSISLFVFDSCYRILAKTEELHVIVLNRKRYDDIHFVPYEKVRVWVDIELFWIWSVWIYNLC